MSVPVGLAVATYGVWYAIAAADDGAVATVLPGGWLAVHGLLDGVLAAVREATGDDEGASEPADRGGDRGDGEDDRPDVDPSAVELARRVPLQ